MDKLKLTKIRTNLSSSGKMVCFFNLNHEKISSDFFGCINSKFGWSYSKTKLAYYFYFNNKDEYEEGIEIIKDRLSFYNMFQDVEIIF